MKKTMLAAVLLTGILQAQESETLIPEVSIASKTSTPLFRTGKPVTLISQADLEKRSGQTLSQILSQTAGIQIAGNFNNPQEPKTVKIRGGKNANILLLIDGVPLKDVTGNDYNLSDLRFFTAETIESIEILNGASSVLYGSNAGVSVININTKKGGNSKITGEAGLKAGSFGLFGQNAGLRGKSGNWNYTLNGANEKSTGISSAAGSEEFDKDGFEKQNIYATIGFSEKYFSAQAEGSFQHHNYGFDTGAFSDGNQRGDDFQQFAGTKIDYRYNNGSLHFNTRFSQNERIGKDLVNGSLQDQFTYKGNHSFAELYNVYSFSQYISLVAGATYEAQKLGAENLPWGGTELEEIYSPAETKNSNADLYANLNLTFFMWNMDLGARYTNHSRFGDHLVYSLNPYFIKSAGDFYLKFGYSFATAFIAPTLYQSYGFMPYILPNENLDPETNASHDVNFSAGRKDESLVLKASLFLRNEENVFAYTASDSDPYIGIFRNVDENQVKGFELEGKYKLNDQLRFGTNFSFVEKEKQATMLRQPKQKWNSYAELTAFRGNVISLSHQYVGKRTDAYYDSADFSVKNVELQAYHLFNLNINQDIAKNLSTFLNIGNLLNTSYTDIAGFSTLPRNFVLGAQYKF